VVGWGTRGKDACEKNAFVGVVPAGGRRGGGCARHSRERDQGCIRNSNLPAPGHPPRTNKKTKDTTEQGMVPDVLIRARRVAASGSGMYIFLFNLRNTASSMS
jgi:hypothetical protein